MEDTQSHYCKAGVTGDLDADDVGSWPSQKDKFCSPAGTAATCPVSCGSCPVESCDEPSQTVPSCVAGIAPTDGMYEDGMDAPAARDEFCFVNGFLNVCQVSCGMCPETCNFAAPLGYTQSYPCKAGVTPNEEYSAQEKKDKYCTLLTQTQCPVSCMGVTNEGPNLCPEIA